MFVTRDGWNVSYDTITYGEGKLEGCVLHVFRRVNNVSHRCPECNKKHFETQDDAEHHAYQHGHLKYPGEADTSLSDDKDVGRPEEDLPTPAPGETLSLVGASH